MQSKINPVKIFFLFFSILLLQQCAFAQGPKVYGKTELTQLFKDLPVCGTVLYVAAHPDDENTRLIAFLAKEKNLNVHYLSLTRGDGGQNLIGTELSEGLGVIRTQELIAARKIDGGHQLFSQARDFGFSKNPEETFTKWPRELILRNVVHTIRRIKPDLIITRFSPKPGPTHGHHTASAQLALEAFSMAATNAFETDMSLHKTEPWQAKRIFWNISSFFFQGREKEFQPEKYLKLDIGLYNPELGLNYQELAALSRSQHKSQGFGSATSRGPNYEYFELLAGDSARNNILEGVETSWTKFGLDAIRINKDIELAKSHYQKGEVESAVAVLVELQKYLLSKESSITINYQRLFKVKQQQINETILGLCGIRAELTTPKPTFVAGSSSKLTLEIVNRSKVAVSLTHIKNLGIDTLPNLPLKNNIPFVKSFQLSLSKTTSEPYWLSEIPESGSFNLSKENQPFLDNDYLSGPTLDLSVDILGLSIPINVVPKHKSVDPVRGELYQPLELLPRVLVKPLDPVIKATLGKPIAIRLEIEAPTGFENCKLQLLFNDGSYSESQTLLGSAGPSKQIITIQHLLKPGQTQATAVVTNAAGKIFDRFLQRIRYDHIPNQVLLKIAQVKFLTAEIKTKIKRVGYIMGAGDEVPQALRVIGYQVDLLSEQDMKEDVLANYKTIVVGIRAYNTHPWLKKAKPLVLTYIKNGGNYVVQYNTANFLSGPDALDSIAPFPIKIGSERVTVEESPVSIYIPHHPTLNKPNKISASDFSGWNQERGLYFAKEWQGPYQAPLGMADPNESEKKGSLIVAEYGKGHYTYTGISFFRLLPAGVPGAYRLFVNLIEQGK